MICNTTCQVRQNLCTFCNRIIIINSILDFQIICLTYFKLINRTQVALKPLWCIADCNAITVIDCNSTCICSFTCNRSLDAFDIKSHNNRFCYFKFWRIYPSIGKGVPNNNTSRSFIFTYCPLFIVYSNSKRIAFLVACQHMGRSVHTINLMIRINTHLHRATVCTFIKFLARANHIPGVTIFLIPLGIVLEICRIPRCNGIRRVRYLFAIFRFDITCGFNSIYNCTVCRVYHRIRHSDVDSFFSTSTVCDLNNKVIIFTYCSRCTGNNTCFRNLDPCRSGISGEFIRRFAAFHIVFHRVRCDCTTHIVCTNIKCRRIIESKFLIFWHCNIKFRRHYPNIGKFRINNNSSASLTFIYRPFFTVYSNSETLACQHMSRSVHTFNFMSLINSQLRFVTVCTFAKS